MPKRKWKVIFSSDRLVRASGQREASVKPWPLQRYVKLLPRMICRNYKAFLIQGLLRYYYSSWKIFHDVWFSVWNLTHWENKIHAYFFTQSSCYFTHVCTVYYLLLCCTFFFYFSWSNWKNFSRRVNGDVSHPTVWFTKL